MVRFEVKTIITIGNINVFFKILKILGIFIYGS